MILIVGWILGRRFRDYSTIAVEIVIKLALSIRLISMEFDTFHSSYRCDKTIFFDRLPQSMSIVAPIVLLGHFLWKILLG